MKWSTFLVLQIALYYMVHSAPVNTYRANGDYETKHKCFFLIIIFSIVTYAPTLLLDRDIGT